MKNNSEKVSVIMSVRNGENTVIKAAESILNQTYKDLEFLIIDDSSEDNTFSEIKKLEVMDSRVKVFQNKENLGLTRSLNRLIKITEGKYIARQDADDYSHIDRISTQVKYLNEKNLDAITSRANVIGSKSKIPGLSFYIPYKIAAKFKNPFIHGTLLIRKRVLQDMGFYDENFYFAQDYKLFLDLLRNDCKIKNLNKILYYLNIENNISSIYKKEQKYYSDCAKKGIVPSE